MIKWAYNFSIYVMIAFIGYWLNTIAGTSEVYWWIFLFIDGIFYLCRRCGKDS